METKFPKVALAMVTGLVVFLIGLIYSALNGEDATEAKRLAQAQLGEHN
ncbi:hypothetical protein [Microseira wollei]|nr:hypothetical protein [Microseira wollei]